MQQRDKIEQARVNALKTARAAVRLRHSIAADDELNELLPKLEKAFNKAIQMGEWPDPITMLERLNA